MYVGTYVQSSIGSLAGVSIFQWPERWGTFFSPLHPRARELCARIIIFGVFDWNSAFVNVTKAGGLNFKVYTHLPMCVCVSVYALNQTWAREHKIVCELIKALFNPAKATEWHYHGWGGRKKKILAGEKLGARIFRGDKNVISNNAHARDLSARAIAIYYSRVDVHYTLA